MNRHGFTLVELMVVVGIIAVLAVATIPAFTGMLGLAHVDAAVADINNAVGQARSLAMNYRMIYTVEFATVTHPSGQNVAVVYIDTGAALNAQGQLVAKDESDAAFAFNTLSDFDDPAKVGAGTTFVPPGYVLEGVQFDYTVSNPVANGGYELGVPGDTDGGKNWPDVAFSPEGYLMDPAGQRRLRLTGADGQVRTIEFLRFGTVRQLD